MIEKEKIKNELAECELKFFDDKLQIKQQKELKEAMNCVYFAIGYTAIYALLLFLIK